MGHQDGKGDAMHLTKQDALQIAEQTQDAYSCDSYSPAGWRQCCVMLAAKGFDREAIETIMRSKWTRWAGDSALTTRYGKHNSTDLALFMDTQFDHHVYTNDGGSLVGITPDNWREHMGLCGLHLTQQC